jgi:hypothetical protein
VSSSPPQPPLKMRPAPSSILRNTVRRTTGF